MLTYLRYALAIVCFAASVGCMALWWRSATRIDVACGPSCVFQSWAVMLESIDGYAFTSLSLMPPVGTNAGLGTSWTFYSSDRQSIGARRETIAWMKKRFGRLHFDTETATAYFPLWYPALIFALAGIASLRLGRRFTLRSALIATTVVAALLGMAVIL